MKTIPARLLALCTVALLAYGCEETKEATPRARPLSQKGSQVLRQLAELHKDKRYDQGVELARTFLVEEPGSPMIHYALGGLLGMKQDHEGAIAAFERELEVNPSHAGTLRGLGIAYTRLGRLEESLPYLRRVVELEPEQSGPAFQLGRNLSTLGRFDEAEPPLRRAGEADNADAWTELGILYRRTGREAEAMAPLQSALRLEPEHLGALVQLGQLLMRSSDEALGRAVLERHAELAVLQDRYDNAEASSRLPGATAEHFRRLAFEQRRRGELDDAIASLHQALARSPGNVDLIRGLVRFYLAAEDPRSASPWAVQQLLTEPDNPQGYLLLALVRIADGEAESARQALGESRARGRWSATEQLELAEAWRQSGDFGSALTAYREMPAGPERDAGRALALAQMGRWDEAAAAVRASAVDEVADARPLEILAIAETEAGNAAAARLALAAAAERRRLDLVAGGLERVLESFSELPGGAEVAETYRSALIEASPSVPSPRRSS